MSSSSDVTRTASEAAAQGEQPLPSVGTIVAERYRLARVIGAGGMGTVFEAEITSVGRRCAIKFLRRELAGRARSAPRFEREARLLARLEHEHITAVFDYGWFGERTPFFVMEYLEGHTLRERLRRDGPLPLAECLELLQQACRGMAHAHAQGVVHRDLKPDNLLLTRHSDGRPWLKILDFGVASSLSEAAVQLTPTGAELGTAHYMAPEQARGERRVDPRADVYALGAISYEALTGQRLHDGASYNEVLFQVLTSAHVPLERVLPACPASLAAVVERCLQKDAAARFRDAGELLEALAAVASQGVSPAAVAQPEPALRAGGAGAALPARLAVRGRLRAGRAALAACVLVALAFVAGARWGARDLGSPQSEAALLPARPAAPGEQVPASASVPPAPSPLPAPSTAHTPETALRAETALPAPGKALLEAAVRRPRQAVAAAALPRPQPARATQAPPAAAAASAASSTVAPALPLVTANPYGKP